MILKDLCNLLSQLSINKKGSELEGTLLIDDSIVSGYQHLVENSQILNIAFTSVIIYPNDDNSDEKDLFDEDQHDNNWREDFEKAKRVKITISISGADSNGGIFEKLDNFLDIDFVNSGHMPQNYYIMDINKIYISGKADDIDFHERLSKSVDFTRKVGMLAQHKTQDTPPKYIFISESSKSNLLTLKLSEQLISKPPNDIAILDEILSSKSSKTLKRIERSTIFFSSLNEFLEKTSSSFDKFQKLFLNWDLFLDLYNDNYVSYTNEFKFDKLKKELAESELTIASKIADVANESSSKVLAIPASLGALALLQKTSDSTSSNVASIILILIGIILATYMMKLIIQAQNNKLLSVQESKKLIFSSLSSKHEQVIELSKNDLDNVSKRLDKDIQRTMVWLKKYSLFSYAPLVIYIILVLTQHYQMLGFFLWYLIPPLF